MGNNLKQKTMCLKLQIALLATANYSNAIKVSMNTEDVTEEMQAFTEGMAEHLLYTGENSDRDGDQYIDLRNEDDGVIEEHVVEYIDQVLERMDDPDMSDDEKKGMERMLNRLMFDGDEEQAKELMAEAVTDYFRNDGDYYLDKNAEGIRVALQDKIAC